MHDACRLRDASQVEQPTRVYSSRHQRIVIICTNWDGLGSWHTRSTSLCELQRQSACRTLWRHRKRNHFKHEHEITRVTQSTLGRPLQRLDSGDDELMYPAGHGILAAVKPSSHPPRVRSGKVSEPPRATRNCGDAGLSRRGGPTMVSSPRPLAK